MSLGDARLAVGIIGNIATLSTSLAPIPTFWRICKKRSTEEFSALPYETSFFCNLLWGWYALPLVTQDNLPLLTICLAQVTLQAIYLILYFIFSCSKRKAKLLYIMTTVVLLFGGEVVLTILVFRHKGARKEFAGSIATASSIATFAAPLSIMGLVVRTKSVEFMPLLVSLSLLFNCLTWTIYGVLGKDLFLTIAESFGLVLALVQLVLYAIYYKSKPHVYVEEALPPSLEGPELNHIVTVEKIQASDQGL